MPQVGLHCVRGNMPHEECRACAQNPLHPCMFGPDVLERMRIHYDDPNREPGGMAATPSRLLGCPRQAVLEDRYDYYSDVEAEYPKFRGNMMHAMMESAPYPGVIGTIRERRLSTTIKTKYGDRRFSGKCDLIILKELGEDNTIHVNIVDYKTISAIGHDLVEAKDEHVWQVNMYAWLVTKVLPWQKETLGKTIIVDGLEIEYFDMKKTRRFTSYGWLQARGKRLKLKPVPEYAVLDLAPIPLYRLDLTERAIQRRVEVKRESSERLPGVLAKEDQWRCMNCPVRMECTALAEEEGSDIPGSFPQYQHK